MKIIKTFIIALVGGIAALACNQYYIGQKAEKEPFTSSVPSYKASFTEQTNTGARNSLNFTLAAEKSVKSVVHVKTATKSKMNYNNDPFRYFFDPRAQEEQVQLGSGSGVIVSADGYIVTNNHVVDGASQIQIILDDKRSFDAKVVGTDAATDLAVLKVDANDLPFIAYGNSDDVTIGEWVLAVGNPFNLTSTVTAGIVSAKARNINILSRKSSQNLNPIESFIQTDAAVNPGNSGGALVNTNGELIGINTAIASNTGSYTGYSFAIPINIASKVVADIVDFGRVQRAFIGVSIRDIDAKLAAEKGIKDLKGVYVEGLLEEGSAKLAGIKKGDVIIEVGEVFVENVASLQEQISRYRPGDEVYIKLRRDNEEKEFTIKLRNKNGTTAIVEKDVNELTSMLGGVLKVVEKDESTKLNIHGGLKVEKLSKGKLQSVGIKEGFIITHVDRKKVEQLADIVEILDGKKGGVLIEGVYPNGMKAYYGFGL